MTPITRISKSDAMKILGIKKAQTFNRWAALLGFTVYPGLRGDMYSKTDVVKKWNENKDQFKRRA